MQPPSKPRRSSLVARRPSQGFTLIEVLIAVSLSTLLLGALYLSLAAALESWRFSRDELALQQVMGNLLEVIMEGERTAPGLRSTLEFTEAGAHALTFLEPAVERHRLISANSAIPLRGHLKPGLGLPTAEYQVKPGDPLLPLTLILTNPDSLRERPLLRPALELPSGTRIRMSYHPDPSNSPDSLVALRWSEKDKSLRRVYRGETTELSKNMFGVVVDRLLFRYFDPLNEEIDPQSGAHGPQEEAMGRITAVEVALKGDLHGHTLDVLGMIMLRNSARQRGVVSLREDLELSIADSRRIKTLVLGNFSGVTSQDVLQVEMESPGSPVYRVRLEFEDVGKERPVLAKLEVECPPGKVIFTDSPRVSANEGLDLLTLGPNGLYDYDDDADAEDPVFAPEGPVRFKVKRMDIGGAALYVRP